MNAMFAPEEIVSYRSMQLSSSNDTIHKHGIPAIPSKTSFTILQPNEVFGVETQNSKWDRPCLRELEMFYPLSKHHAKISEENLHLVIGRLKEVFRRASIQAHYQNLPVGKVTCETLDRVTFVVTLWKRGNSVVLEVQYSAGDRSSFHSRYLKYVYQAVNLSVNLSELSFEDDSHRRIPIPTQIDLQQREVHVLSAIEIAADLLCKDRYDARMLGLESLSLILDESKKQDQKSPCAVAKGILVGKGKLWKPVHDCILCLALTGYWWQEEEDGICMQDQRYLALSILAKAVSLADDQDIIAMVAHVNEMLSSHMYLSDASSLSTLLLQYFHAADYHIAFQASLILESLCSRNIKTILQDLQTQKELVERTHRIVAQYHYAFGNSSQSLLNCLNLVNAAA